MSSASVRLLRSTSSDPGVTELLTCGFSSNTGFTYLYSFSIYSTLPCSVIRPTTLPLKTNLLQSSQIRYAPRVSSLLKNSFLVVAITFQLRKTPTFSPLFFFNSSVVNFTSSSRTDQELPYPSFSFHFSFSFFHLKFAFATPAGDSDLQSSLSMGYYFSFHFFFYYLYYNILFNKNQMNS